VSRVEIRPVSVEDVYRALCSYPDGARVAEIAHRFDRCHWSTYVKLRKLKRDGRAERIGTAAYEVRGNAPTIWRAR
jgi:hypothetical protein